MRGGYNHVFHVIFLFRTHARYAASAAFLVAVRSQRNAFDVIVVRQRDNDCFFGDEVGKVNVGRVIRYLRAARVAEFGFDSGKFLFDDIQDFMFISENFV